MSNKSNSIVLWKEIKNGNYDYGALFIARLVIHESKNPLLSVYKKWVGASRAEWSVFST